MDIIAKLKTLGYAFMIGVFMFACSQETQNETNAEVDEVQTDANDAAIVVDDDYRETSAWVDTNSSRAETASESEWEEMKKEYKQREARLDGKSNTWDDKAKQEWQEVKSRWKKTEEKVESRLKGTDDVDVDVDVEANKR